VIICDGHDSRLQPTFIEYIDNEKTKWLVLLGVPYGTSYWQVADSSEQNDMFNMNWVKKKIDHLQGKAQLTTYLEHHRYHPYDFESLGGIFCCS